MNAIAILKEQENLPQQDSERIQFVTFRVHQQLFGIPALLIEEVISMLPITKIPLAPKEIAGTLNLRGRIVTAIDTRIILNLPERNPNDKFMNIVVSNKNDLYSIIVDEVNEVMDLPRLHLAPNPASMNENWQKYSEGVFQIKEELLVILNPNTLLNLKEKDEKRG